ncbi:MAG: hypothetical protein QF735_08230, partial [Phycisphaeraceae bacterium]|nr:hypothetical protein [Phycisphaeraceae bacterium]
MRARATDHEHRRRSVQASGPLCPDTVCVWEEARITLLNLFNMGLNGNIPDEIGDLTELKQLGLKSNNLS